LDYTTTSKGLSSLWTTMIKNKTPQKFDLKEGAVDESLAKADTKLEAFPFKKLVLFSNNKPCPIAHMFGGAELDIGVHKRIKKKNNDPHHTCPMVENTCCTSLSFLNMESRWNELMYPLESYHKSGVKILKFISGEFIDKGVIKKPMYSEACLISDEAHKNCDTKWQELKEASKKFLTETIPKYSKAFNDVYAVFNDIRKKLACMACDPSAEDSYNLEAKTVRVERETYKNFADKI